MAKRGRKRRAVFQSRFKRPTGRIIAVARHYLRLVSAGVRPLDAKTMTVIHFQSRPYFQGVDFDTKHIEKCVRAYRIQLGEIEDHRVTADVVHAWERWEQSTDPKEKEWLAQFMSDYSLVEPITRKDDLN